MTLSNIVKLKPIFRILLVLVLAYSCGTDFIVTSKKNIAKNTWLYKDTLKYHFDIEDTTKLYNLYFDVNHDINYPNQNIYVKVTTIFPNGKSISQPVSLELADDTGKWLGKCGNVSCEAEILLQSKAFFDTKGQYMLMVEQFMRQDSLKGISSITFKIEETDEVRPVSK
ncbi:MAG: gliding motility lipoprotein GldH [Saprospiraceae bacterium]|nr:gliding motility lipoprotein GldH [Saprospiraceae bacterium]